VICVLGDSLPVNSQEAAVIHSVVRKLADVAIVTDAVAGSNAEWLSTESSKSKLQVATDRGEAIAWAVAIAAQGDVVVIAGSRTPAGFNFGSTEISDADAARELLYALASPALRLVG
jgi:UDP-N-acetylmuramyl tripeptide synthase